MNEINLKIIAEQLHHPSGEKGMVKMKNQTNNKISIHSFKLLNEKDK